MIQRQPATTTPPAAPAPAGGQQTGGTPGTGLPPGVKLMPPPPPGGALVRHTGTQVTFTDQPEYVRYQLEEYVNQHGLDSVKRFEMKDELCILGDGPISLDPAPQAPPADGYLKRVIKTVHDELVTLRVHLDAYRDDFQRRANDTLNTLLDDSKVRIEKEMDRYGIKENRTTILGKSPSSRRKPAAIGAITSVKSWETGSRASRRCGRKRAKTAITSGPSNGWWR